MISRDLTNLMLIYSYQFHSVEILSDIDDLESLAVKGLITITDKCVALTEKGNEAACKAMEAFEGEYSAIN